MKIKINNPQKINLTTMSKFHNLHWVKPSNLSELYKLFACADLLWCFVIKFKNWLHKIQ